MFSTSIYMTWEELCIPVLTALQGNIRNKTAFAALFDMVYNSSVCKLSRQSQLSISFCTPLTYISVIGYLSWELWFHFHHSLILYCLSTETASVIHERGKFHIWTSSYGCRQSALFLVWGSYKWRYFCSIWVNMAFSSNGTFVFTITTSTSGWTHCRFAWLG